MLGCADPHLALALEQEEQLGLEGVARHVVVEAVEERVLGRLLEHQVGADAAASKRASVVLPAPIGPSTAMWRKRASCCAHVERKTK